jgi:hypothetical protein
MGLKEAGNTNTQASAANAQLSLDGKTYSVTLADNETAAAFRYYAAADALHAGAERQ